MRDARIAAFEIFPNKRTEKKPDQYVEIWGKYITCLENPDVHFLQVCKSGL